MSCNSSGVGGIGLLRQTKKSIYFYVGGSAPHTPQKSAATAASRGTSLLRFTFLLFFLHQWENSQGIFSPVQGQLTLHRWKNSLGFFSPVQGQIDLLRLAAQRESKYSISTCTGEKIPWEFFHRCRVKWPCTEWICSASSSETTNKYINSKQKSVWGRLDKNDQKRVKFL